MTRSELLSFLSLGMIATGLLLLRALVRQDLREHRIMSVQQIATSLAVRSDAGILLRLIASLGGVMSKSGLLPASTLAELEQTLVSAGMRQGNALALFVGGKLICCLLLPMLAYGMLHGTSLSPMVRVICIAIGAVIGLLLPDFIVRSRRNGTPLSQAVRTLSTEMRYEMLMRFEAQAARLPVLLTVPMILFILPCIFIVVGGPAGLTVTQTFIYH